MCTLMLYPHHRSPKSSMKFFSINHSCTQEHCDRGVPHCPQFFSAYFPLPSTLPQNESTMRLHEYTCYLRMPICWQVGTIWGRIVDLPKQVRSYFYLCSLPIYLSKFTRPWPCMRLWGHRLLGAWFSIFNTIWGDRPRQGAVPSVVDALARHCIFSRKWRPIPNRWITKNRIGTESKNESSLS